MFDVSNRVQYITIRENKMNWNYKRNHDLQFIEDDLSECTDDDSVIVLARMSISHGAIRAGALACGLWRTVTCVRLPKGLFEKHWFMWREKKHSFEEVYDENDVWALLQMLRETFPHLDQVDFGGDTAQTFGEAFEDDVRREWKNEIISRVLQILPKLVAIDGNDVTGRVIDVPCSPHAEFVPLKKEEEVVDQLAKHASSEIKSEDVNAICDHDAKSSSSSCVVCEDMQMCGWAHLVEAQAQTIQEAFSFEVTNTVRSDSLEVEAVASFAAPEQCSVARDISSDAIEDVSHNILSMIEGCVGPTQERNGSYTLDYAPTALLEPDILEHDNEESDQMLSSPASSNSWEATNNASRPPVCPGSSTHQRRVPKLPLGRKKSKGSALKASFKRRVLGLIPSTSVMDEEDDESDGDEQENSADECPADLL
jgi:hypothetical protein